MNEKVTLLKRPSREELVMIGENKVFKYVLEMAGKYAMTDMPILILGESGTGKSLLAKYIHEFLRSKKPFIKVSAPSIPENLIESEIFGYERGAFSGATRKKPGVMEQVGKGILFLDEIGEIPLSLQVKFLSVLEDRVFCRLGGSETYPFLGQVVLATNRTLEDLSDGKMMRKDLFFRISSLKLILPPLRERKEDILSLAEHFRETFLETFGIWKPRFSEDAEEKILSYDWPGNVRELKGVIESAVIACNKNLILPEHIQINNYCTTRKETIDKKLELEIQELRNEIRIIKTLGSETEALRLKSERQVLLAEIRKLQNELQEERRRSSSLKIQNNSFLSEIRRYSNRIEDLKRELKKKN